MNLENLKIPSDFTNEEAQTIHQEILECLGWTEETEESVSEILFVFSRLCAIFSAMALPKEKQKSSNEGINKAIAYIKDKDIDLQKSFIVCFKNLHRVIDKIELDMNKDRIMTEIEGVIKSVLTGGVKNNEKEQVH